jgi:acetoin utilization protein AcuB
MNLNTPISTLMTKNVKCVQPDQKIIDLKHIYEQPNFHHHIPVVENDLLVGMISLIDFMRAIHTASLDDNEAVYHELLVKDIMTLHPVSISENTSIEAVVNLLAKGEFHSVVVTEDSHVKGIVTTADLLRFFLKNN